MPCRDALIESPIYIDSNSSIDSALDLMSENGLRKMPVLDSHGHLVGMFGLCTLLTNLLPVSARIEDGIPSLDFIKGSAAGVAKRLKKLKSHKVREFMVPLADMPTVRLDTPIWEVIRLIVKHGSPLAVMDADTKNFTGLVSEQSILSNLENLIEEMEKTPQTYFR